MNRTAFAEMELSKEVLKSISEMGFEQATSIQAETIPLLLSGTDLMGQSRTGTGKTLAFALPVVEKIDLSKKGVQALILCPTRELCIQVSEEVAKLSKHRRGLLALPIYGGQSYDRQITGLKRGAQIVIGTPGRLIDHMRRGTLKLDTVAMVVLDEADEMLDMGFQEDLETILQQTPKTRQTALFSATMPAAIQQIARKYLNKPQVIKVKQESLSVPAIDQSYIEVRGQMKLEALCRCLDFHNVDLGIVFCNTKLGVDDLVGHLQARGYSAEGLHGGHSQAQRDRIMGHFRNGRCEILVATDVASRGIDVKDIQLVVNYDLPKDIEDYVHRIGRTGRAGKTGKAISFASGKEVFRLRSIEKYANTKIRNTPLPSFAQVEAMQQMALLEKVRETLIQGGLEKYVSLVEALSKEEFTATDVACGLFKMLGTPSGKAKTAGESEGNSATRSENEGRYSSGSNYSGSDREGRGNRNEGRNDKEFRKKDRGDREPREQSAFPESIGKRVVISLNVGRQRDVRPKDILGALANETGLPGFVFGAIKVDLKQTLVEVPEQDLELILQKMEGTRIKSTVIHPKRSDY